MKQLLKQLRKADEDYHLIQDDDVIVIGVSGGKDSMLLLKALSVYQEFANKNFSLIAIHMKMGFPLMDATVIKEYANLLQVPYYEEEVPIYEILQNYKKEDGSLDCSRCSKLKRGAIVGIAKKLNANKVAFAHHGDDAIETFFLNALYGGKIQTFQPKIDYKDNEISFIRPFIYVKECDIIRNVKKEDIPIVVSTCPKDGNSQRTHIKKRLDDIYKDYPMAQNNLLKMLANEDIKLWKKEKK